MDSSQGEIEFIYECYRDSMAEYMEVIKTINENLRNGIRIDDLVENKDELSFQIEELRTLLNERRRFWDGNQLEIVNEPGKPEIESLQHLLYYGLDLGSRQSDHLFIQYRNKQRDIISENLSPTDTSLLKEIGSHFTSEPIGDDETHKKVYKKVFTTLNTESTRKGKKVMKKLMKQGTTKLGTPITFSIPNREFKWSGGSLSNWLQLYEKETVVEVALREGELTKKEARLSEKAKFILRGIMNKVQEKHKKGICHGNLTAENVALNERLEVLYLHANKEEQLLLGKAGKREAQQLKALIIQMIGDNQTPKDVDHLKALLRGPSFDDTIYHHSCMWSPMEMVANILMFRIEFQDCPEFGDQASSLKGAVSSIEEEGTDWKNELQKYSLYKEAYKRWQQELDKINQQIQGERDLHFQQPSDYLMGSAPILSFLRMCISHVFEMILNDAGPQKSGNAQDTQKKLVDIEQDLFIIFPTYIPHFIHKTRDYRHIRDIYTRNSDFLNKNKV